MQQYQAMAMMSGEINRQDLLLQSMTAFTTGNGTNGLYLWCFHCRYYVQLVQGILGAMDKDIKKK
jgi:hypothetical protein